ncbi:hypothetical protein KPH14_006909 [Odynerus spinipes]|uniref:O-acyltransferase n=1 Tax=Odynerus spinipes TaxID=1348599 RepID=A0AAD9VSK6_9HYME|nr:hypothetical protein KPH14_006909 [Odynerus spinipes]
MDSKDEATTDDGTTKLKHRTSSTMNGYVELTNSRVVNNGKGKTIDDATVTELRIRMQKMSENIMGHVNDRINDMISEVLNELETSIPNNGKQVSDNLDDKYRDKRKSSKGGFLPEKEFLERDSLLTELFNTDKHVRTIYNIFMVILILLFLNTITYDFMYTGSVHVGMSTIMKSFGKFSSVLYIWLLMTITTLAIYIPFNVWASKRLDYPPTSYALRIWDYGWLVSFVLYLILFVVMPLKAVLSEGLPCVSSTVVLMEQVRMLMKSYAFIRSTAPRFLTYKQHSEMTQPTMPDFSRYLYFFFAPTLIYRDSYPRTKSIRWKIALWHYFEVLLVIFYSAFICERFFKAAFMDFGKEPIGYKEVVINILNTSMPGILFFLCGFYLLLHAWMNACAEVMRFADRLFYKDWWTSTSYRTYYRAWNVVVHDWLYTYVYKDIYEILTNQNRFFAASFASPLFLSQAKRATSSYGFRSAWATEL